MNNQIPKSGAQLYILAMKAEIAANEEYSQTGTFHADMCNCADCQALHAWNGIGWWGRILAKIEF